MCAPQSPAAGVRSDSETLPAAAGVGRVDGIQVWVSEGESGAESDPF